MNPYTSETWTLQFLVEERRKLFHDKTRHSSLRVGTNGIYNGCPVPYVPSSTFNLGATYHFKSAGSRSSRSALPIRRQADHLQQPIAAPGDLTMPSYGTVNLGLTAPFKHFTCYSTGWTS